MGAPREPQILAGGVLWRGRREIGKYFGAALDERGGGSEGEDRGGGEVRRSGEYPAPAGLLVVAWPPAGAQRAVQIVTPESFAQRKTPSSNAVQT